MDCVILNNSPYSLESRTLENAQPGNQQTVAHFCKIMSENARYNGGQSHSADEPEKLCSEGCLSDSGKEKWGATTYNRNNFGLVHNYFCPNDQVVSMLPVQGMGWRGIPDNISVQMGANLRQRAFCKDVNVGDKTGEHFVMPEAKQNDPEIPGQDVKYIYQDVTVSGAVLPELSYLSFRGKKKAIKLPCRVTTRISPGRQEKRKISRRRCWTCRIRRPSAICVTARH